MAYDQTARKFALLGDTHLDLSDAITKILPYTIADAIEWFSIPGNLAEERFASKGSEPLALLEQGNAKKRECSFTDNDASFMNLEYSSSSYSETIETNKQEFLVSPNPASDFITISGVSGETIIYDSLGNKVWFKTINESYRIDLSSFKDGLYFIKNGHAVQKIIILKK
jgi:hypothetical protein